MTRLLPILLLVLWPFIAGFGPTSLVENDQQQHPISADQLRVFRPLPPMSLTAAAAVAMDAESGHVLFDYHGSDRRAPASTTKVMTALLALERGKLTDRVRAGPGVFGSLTGTGSSIMGIQYDDVYSLEELLYGLMLPSGNDAALLIAEQVGGSVEGFVAMMNGRAAELGMKDSHFANPHGLDADGHYMSARDLAVATREAMRHALFRKIVATRLYTIEQPRQMFLLNTNRLIDNDKYPGFDGVKSGYTERAGQSLVGSIARDGHRIITVVLDAADRDLDTVRLASYVYENFAWTDLAPATALPFLGDDGQVYKVVHSAPGLFVDRWQVPFIRRVYEFDRRLPALSRTPIGKVVYRVGATPLMEYPVLPGTWGQP